MNALLQVIEDITARLNSCYEQNRLHEFCRHIAGLLKSYSEQSLAMQAFDGSDLYFQALIAPLPKPFKSVVEAYSYVVKMLFEALLSDTDNLIETNISIIIRAMDINANQSKPKK